MLRRWLSYLPVPPGVSLKDAAAFPEVACTVWSTIFMTSRLTAGESLLVHGGSSGIGAFAIQIERVFITAGLAEPFIIF
ncbi:Alcohol dehydrogenase superfamily, zinc-type [Trema orientale]|uniref:Alcohol dehydrogenase superfamily, zinc-type n=1 Tax=Trema orientale TaxID=63057 RepID=A0A2P5G0U9_TREOI|nr:Alcohol dehydrogenase superfamily, zinc-type [Trema orientale]